MGFIFSIILWVLYLYTFVLGLVLLMSILKHCKLVQEEQSKKLDELLAKITEPFLSKLRPYIPIKTTIDITPLVAIILLSVIANLIAMLWAGLASASVSS